MSELQRVRVVNPDNTWMGTHCYINDEELERVKSVDFHVEVNKPPLFRFEIISSDDIIINGATDIDMPAEIKFGFTPETISESVAVIRNELLKHGEFYDGFLASIESSLREQDVQGLPFGDTQSEIAEKILKRIVGEDL